QPGRHTICYGRFPKKLHLFSDARCGEHRPMDSLPLYRQLAAHYVDAIHAGSLKAGDKLPSLRSLMRLHDISLSTALQVCRAMESEGWVEARDRSGYFVRRPQRLAIAAMEEPVSGLPP